MNTSPIAITSPSSLRNYIEEQVFLLSTEDLQKQNPKVSYSPEANRKFCVDAMWGDPMNLSHHIETIAAMELEWRQNPEKAELRPSLV